MTNNFNKAFTLVELIVVITILAVLATVAFISFQWYSAQSRDAKRMSDVSTVMTGLQVYTARNWFVPEPSDDRVAVEFSWKNLFTQWYAGKSVLDRLRVQDAKDPIENQFYTYAVNTNKTKYQITAFLEANPTANINNSYQLFAEEYWNRKIYSQWQTVWSLFNEDNTPIHELWNNTVELSNNSQEYKVVFSKNEIDTLSEENLFDAIVFAQRDNKFWREIDTSCIINDISIWNQVWAGCNSIFWNGLEWWETDQDLLTPEEDYSWSLSSCHNYDWGNDNSIDCAFWSDQMKSTSSAKDFFDIKQPDWQNTNWDTEYDTIWGKLYTWDNADSACPSGWKLPSNNDVSTLFSSLQKYNDHSICEPGECIWWEEHSSQDRYENFTNLLKVPLSGSRHRNNVSYNWRGSYFHLWTSDSTQLDAYTMQSFFNSDGINNNAFRKWYAFSVRCLKDS